VDEHRATEPLDVVAVLADPVRRALYHLVARSADPVSRDMAADALGLPRSTAAFHLDRLAAEGLLAVDYQRLHGRTGPGAGRPSKLYRRADVEVAVTVPERRYDLAGELLAAAVAESTTTGAPVAKVLPRLARGAGRRLGADGDSLRDVLEHHGFEPRPDSDGGAVLANCPFHRLARRFTPVICGMNLELLRGAAETTGDDEHALVLDPAPGRCCVRIPRRSAERGD